MGRALAGVTVPSVNSAIGHTAEQCKQRLEQQGRAFIGKEGGREREREGGREMTTHTHTHTHTCSLSLYLSLLPASPSICAAGAEEKLALVKTLAKKLAKGVTLPKVLELLDACRPQAPAVAIGDVPECSEVCPGVRAQTQHNTTP